MHVTNAIVRIVGPTLWQIQSVVLTCVLLSIFTARAGCMRRLALLVDASSSICVDISQPAADDSDSRIHFLHQLIDTLHRRMPETEISVIRYFNSPSLLSNGFQQAGDCPDSLNTAVNLCACNPGKFGAAKRNATCPFTAIQFAYRMLDSGFDFESCDGTLRELLIISDGEWSKAADSQTVGPLLSSYEQNGNKRTPPITNCIVLEATSQNDSMETEFEELSHRTGGYFNSMNSNQLLAQSAQVISAVFVESMGLKSRPHFDQFEPSSLRRAWYDMRGRKIGVAPFISQSKTGQQVTVQSVIMSRKLIAHKMRWLRNIEQ